MSTVLGYQSSKNLRQVELPYTKLHDFFHLSNMEKENRNAVVNLYPMLLQLLFSRDIWGSFKSPIHNFGNKKNTKVQSGFI